MALVFFTGGARSGKSAAAQDLASQLADQGRTVCPVVFAREHDGDPELAARIARHQHDRPQGFSVVEAADNPDWIDDVADDCVILLDCLGTLLGSIMERIWDEMHGAKDFSDADAVTLPDGYETRVTQAFGARLGRILAREGDAIVVSNEVGDGVVPQYASARLFRDLLGRANREFARRADAAYLCVCGRLIALDRLPTRVTWPED